MADIHRFRAAMARYFDQALTPEIACAIEAEVFDEPDRSIEPARFLPHHYRGFVFAVERLSEILPELHPLHEEHWATTEKARSGVPLAPDYPHMRACERAGTLIQFTARKDGRLVGNARFYLFKDLHSGTHGVREDTYFLRPEARVGFTAIRFWQYAERCLEELLGDFEVWTDTKILRDDEGNVVRDVGRLNEYLGYTHVSNRWHKRFTKE